MVSVSEMTDRMCELFDLHDKNYDRDIVECEAERFLKAKQPLIELLRKDPHWEEDNLCVHYDYDTVRTIDKDAFISIMNDVIYIFMNFFSLKIKHPIIKEDTKVVFNSIVSGNIVLFDDTRLNNGFTYVVYDKDVEKYKDKIDKFKDLYECKDTIAEKLRSICYMELSKTVTYDNHTAFINDDFGFIEGQKLSRALRAYFTKIKINEVIDLYAEDFNNKLKYLLDNDLPYNLDDNFYYVYRNLKNERETGLHNGDTKVLNFEQMFGKIADILNPLNVKRHTMLSVNPCDFLHMSYGYRWHSCHNIDDGCYMAGTLSYAGDDCSMILYTIDKSFDGTTRYDKEQRINREMFFYQDGVLVQSRIYPDYNDNENMDNFRNFVQAIIARCENRTNYWTLKRGSDRVDEFVETCIGSKHYPDYDYSQYKANVSLLRDKYSNEDYQSMVIGSTCYYIDTGNEIEDSESITEGRDRRCACCGSYHDEDDMYFCEENGEWYCENCVHTCDRCGELIYGEDYHEDCNGNSLCDYCYENYYAECHMCGEIYSIDDLYFDENAEEYYCGDCIEKYFRVCDKCGSIIRKEDAICEDGKCYCEDCFELLEEEEEEEEEKEVE